MRSGLKRAYDLFGRAGVGGQAAARPGRDFLQASATSLMPSSAEPPGTVPGNPGLDRRGHFRYDLRITFAEAVKGTDEEIEFRALGRCPTCAGSGAKPGTSSTACSRCDGRGELREVRSTMLGQMVNVTACPKCHGEGKIVVCSVQGACHGDRPQRASSDAAREAVPAGIDEGHQIRLSGEGEEPDPGAAWLKASISPSTSSRTGVLKRDGTELCPRPAGVSIAAWAALGTTVTIPAIDGDESLEIKPDTQPAPRSVSGAETARSPGEPAEGLHVFRAGGGADQANQKTA